MTIREIASQLHYLTSGHINGTKFSKRELEQALTKWMQNPEGNAIPNTYVLELTLPDGNWYSSVSRFADCRDGYDYYIPDTREDEAILLSKLIS